MAARRRKIDWWKSSSSSVNFDYLNFPSTWRDIHFTPFENYSIERQALRSSFRPFFIISPDSTVDETTNSYAGKNNTKLNKDFSFLPVTLENTSRQWSSFALIKMQMYCWRLRDEEIFFCWFCFIKVKGGVDTRTDT